MSEFTPEPGPELVRPLPPRTWRETLARLAESFDLSARRLAVGLVVVVVGGVVAWRLLAPPAPAAEMEMPYASPTTAGTGAAPGASTPPPGAPGPPAGAPASGAPAAGAPGTGAVPTEVVVHVAGAVVTPGVQRLPAGARVVDAVDRSGGARPDAELARVNLAAPLVDGQQVYVPVAGETVPAPPPGASSPAGAGGRSPAGPSVDGGSGQLVNLNSATAEELDTLPGVGPATAEAILSHRDANGPFTSVDQLLDVRGIGDAKLEQLRDLVTV